MNTDQRDSDLRELSEINRRRERPTYSDLIDRLLSVMTRTAGERSSVKLTRNARGDTQIEVMVRTGEHDIGSIDGARLEAKRQYDLLAAAYPMLEPGGAK